MKNPKLLIRIASGLVLFFAIGHSIGHSLRHDNPDPRVNSVIQQMTDIRFDFFGNETSLDGQYTGMSLNLIFTLLTFVLVLWFISSRCNEVPGLSLRLLLPIAFCLLGFSITSFLYFFMVPAVTCMLAFVFLVFAVQNLRKIQ